MAAAKTRSHSPQGYDITLLKGTQSPWNGSLAGLTFEATFDPVENIIAIGANPDINPDSEWKKRMGAVFDDIKQNLLPKLGSVDPKQLMQEQTGLILKARPKRSLENDYQLLLAYLAARFPARVENQNTAHTSRSSVHPGQEPQALSPHAIDTLVNEILLKEPEVPQALQATAEMHKDQTAPTPAAKTPEPGIPIRKAPREP